eukprot:3949622-Amphidinium_carterae.2
MILICALALLVLLGTLGCFPGFSHSRNPSTLVEGWPALDQLRPSCLSEESNSFSHTVLYQEPFPNTTPIKCSVVAGRLSSSCRGTL